MNKRIENDFMGSVEISSDALYGINAMRASVNFPDITRFHYSWYCAMGIVKKACYLTYRKYSDAVKNKYPNTLISKSLFNSEIIDALIRAADEVSEGMHFQFFIIPSVQGGAGTSINLNINEIIANRALQLTGHVPGEYDYIHPIDHANIFQSTNDVVPTALKVTILKLLNDLEKSINQLRSSVESLERETRNHFRIGYTEMQEAVPSTYGRLFSTYNDALSRDWWRTSKCAERIKTVNLGGSAIGSGITVPSFFIKEATGILNEITGLPLSRAENLHDATCNIDSFVEIHAIMKAHSVNLEKMVSDIRLLSSDLMKEREIILPPLQTGSSIMPGKVNPVIPEFVISSCHKIYSNDLLISGLCGQGCLDLNAYLPVIGHALIESLNLLIACDNTINDNMMKGLGISKDGSLEKLTKNPSISTALVPYIGYKKASEIAYFMKNKNVDLFEANRNLNFLEEEKIKDIISVDNLLKEGFSVKDII